MAAPVVTFINKAGTAGTKAVNGESVTTSNVASFALNTDNVLEGSNSAGEKVSATTITGYLTGAAVTGEPFDLNASGDHIFAIIQAQGTVPANGIRVTVADDAATDAYGSWYVGPKAGYLGGWVYYVINPALDFDVLHAAGTAGWTAAGNPDQLTSVDGLGAGWQITNTIMGASDNCFLDVISIGAGYRLTNGDAGSTEGKFSDFTTYEDTSTNRYGAIQNASGVILPLGVLRIGFGSGAGNTEFIDSGFTVVWQDARVASDFYLLSFEKGSGTTDVTLSNGSLAAAGTTEVYLDFAGATSVTITNLNVDRARLIDLDAAVNWNGGLVKNSGVITATAAIFTNVTVQTPTVAADASAVVWNDSGDPDGNIDGLTISKGTNAHHAIAFGTSSPTSITLRNIAFSGFNASNAQNDSTLHVLRTTGTVTINLVGCSGNISYKTAGATVVLVTDPVTLSIHVQDIETAAAISGARVLAVVNSSASGWPYDESVTITSAGTTATVTHTGHGLTTNDYVLIEGANEAGYNGVFQITVTGTNTYTYTMLFDPASPATGTITSTFVVISGTTDGSGNISATYSYASDQVITGRVRKSSASPYYVTAPIAGTIDSAAGLSLTIQMVQDE